MQHFHLCLQPNSPVYASCNVRLDLQRALTKLDGTAKGGIVIAVADALQIPVKLIGVGEQMDDLMPFEPRAFVDALI